MSYALIKRIPLNTGLFTRTAKEQIDWAKYGLGFHPDFGTVVGRIAPEVEGDDGLFHNVIYIRDEGKFDSQLPTLQSFIDSTPNPLDSVEKISDEEAEDCKDLIAEYAESISG